MSAMQQQSVSSWSESWSIINCMSCVQIIKDYFFDYGDSENRSDQPAGSVDDKQFQDGMES